MKNSMLLVALFGALALSGCSLDTIKEERVLDLPADAVTGLDIDTRSGDIIVRGDENAKTIHAVASVQRSKNVKAESIIFTLEQDGSKAKLVSDSEGSFGLMNIRSIDITVTVPRSLKLNVKDGSGDMEISAVDAVENIDDDSGDIEVRDAKGTIAIDDDSGDITLVNVEGLRSIQDDSGDMTLQDTKGDAEIRDNSGDLDVIRCTGSLKVDDESGDIVIRNLDGSVTVDDGSGDIEINEVTGNVSIQSAGSGDMTVQGVKGTFTK